MICTNFLEFVEDKFNLNLAFIQPFYCFALTKNKNSYIVYTLCLLG